MEGRVKTKCSINIKKLFEDIEKFYGKKERSPIMRVAEKTGIHPDSIYKWKRGVRTISLDHCYFICDVLGFDFNKYVEVKK